MARTNYRKGSQQFINPYNFVSVDWEQSNKKDIGETHGSITGVMNCRIYTKTPIAIPDTASVNEDAAHHKTYTFMRNTDGKMMIPGSSLRGVIRSVYETVTDSCFVTSDVKQIITRRAEMKMKEYGDAYLLVPSGNGWELREADRYLIKIDDGGKHRPFNKPAYKHCVTWTEDDLKRHKYGEEISFEPAEPYKKSDDENEITVGTVVKEINQNGSMGGYLYLGEVPPLDEKGRCQTTKHFESIFREKDGAKVEVVPDDLIDSIKTIYRKYNDEAVNRCLTKDHQQFYAGVIECIEQKRTLPVWYNQKTKKVSLASIGRIAYRRTMGDMLGVKSPCTELKSLCKGCSLFGMAKNEGKVGSRIRITDAVSCGEEKTIQKVVLRELASPHISYEPFYLQYKNDNFCTYDTQGATLRGRKYYWHDTRKEIYKETEKTERNATMDLADGGDTAHQNEFAFRIYFNNITKDQLEELKWVLTLGENNSNSKKCHKIGHGKAIGLGSVKITIENIMVRDYNLKESRYINSESSLKVKNYKELEFDRLSCKDLLRISDMTVTDRKNVSYPFIENSIRNDNDTASHKWFSENKSKGKRKKEGVEQPWISINDTPAKRFYAYRKE